MKTSRQARRDAKELFRCCLVDGLLDEPRVRDAVNRVLAEKPRGYFAILSHFQRLVKLELQRRAAKVESAVPLTPALTAEVQANLSRLYGAGLSFAFGANPALIGGLRIQVGCDVYDGTVQARLERLAETF